MENTIEEETQWKNTIEEETQCVNMIETYHRRDISNQTRSD